MYILRMEDNSFHSHIIMKVLSQSVLDDIFHEENPIPQSAVDYMRYFTQPEAPVTFSQDTYLLGWRRGYYRGRFRVVIIMHD